MTQNKKPKIALVHDFLKEYGGAERVLEALHDIWPDAPVYTSFVDWNRLGPHAERLRSWDIRQSWVSNVWPVKKLISPLRFIAPYVWESFDFSEYDIVISSSSWYITKGIITKPPTVHICYLHTPPRYLYGYQTAREWRKYWPIRLYATIVNHQLRMYDYKTSQRVDHFIANSIETRRRIEKFYRRESTVIYPPVEISKSQIANLPRGKAGSKQKNGADYQLPINDYYLVVSRLARAKHIDLAIKACQKLGENLMIVGKGPDKEYLKSKIQMSNIKSNPNVKIQMLGEISDEELPELYANAKALLFPAEDEEFGIVPVEAMGYGTPVVAYRSGGVVETVIAGKTGLFFDKLTIDSLTKAMRKLPKTKTITSNACKKRAQEFSKVEFTKNITQFVNKHYK